MNGQLARRRSTGSTMVWIVVVLGSMGAVALGAVSMMNRGSGADQAAERQLYTVKESSFDLVIPTSGELEAQNSIEIRNKLESRATIKWIIEEGSQVQVGDVLVRFASDQIEDRIAKASLDVSSVENMVESAQRTLSIQKSSNDSDRQRADVKVVIAELELQSWSEGQTKTKLNELNLALEKATRNLDRFKREFAESENLYAQDFISQSELEQDEIQLLEGEATLKNATLALNTYQDYTYPKEEKQKKSDLEDARAELERTIERNANQLAQKETDLSARQEQKRLQEQELERFKEQLEACTVIAPAEGLVVYGTSIGGGGMRWRTPEPLDIGQEVHQNQLLISLPDTLRLVASVKVHESQFNQIEAGMTATIRVDAVKGATLEGKVRNVGVMAAQSFGSQVREYTVKINITDDNKWSLKPSMRCKADIFLGHVENAIAVPIQAVQVEKGKHFVWVEENGKYRQQPVKIGRTSEMMIEIKEGLTPGLVVLLRDPQPAERA